MGVRLESEAERRSSWTGRGVLCFRENAIKHRADVNAYSYSYGRLTVQLSSDDHVDQITVRRPLPEEICPSADKKVRPRETTVWTLVVMCGKVLGILPNRK